MPSFLDTLDQITTGLQGYTNSPQGMSQILAMQGMNTRDQAEIIGQQQQVQDAQYRQEEIAYKRQQREIEQDRISRARELMATMDPNDAAKLRELMALDPTAAANFLKIQESQAEAKMRQQKTDLLGKVFAGGEMGGDANQLAAVGALTNDPQLLQLAQFQQGQQNRPVDEANRLAAEDRAQTRQIAEENRRNKAETDKDLKKISVPDFDIQPDIIPSAKDAEAVKKANAAAQKLIRLGETLKGLTDKNGFKYTMDVPFSDKKLGDPIAKQMDSIVQQMKLEQKTIDDLGALVGADFKFLNQFPDPTSMIDAQSMGDVKTWKTQMDDFLGRSKMAVNDIASARGYVPKNSGSTSDLVTPTSQYPEGTKAQNANGDIIVMTNGKWVAQ